MSDSYIIKVPEITAASFSVNPTVINAKTVLRVTVTEKEITLEPYYYYSGDLYAGEV